MEPQAVKLSNLYWYPSKIHSNLELPGEVPGPTGVSSDVPFIGEIYLKTFGSMDDHFL